MKGAAAIPGAGRIPGWTQNKANRTKPPIDYHKDLKRHGTDIGKQYSKEEKEACWNMLSKLAFPQDDQAKIKEDVRKQIYAELGISPEARLLSLAFGEDPYKVTLAWNEESKSWKVVPWSCHRT